MAFLIYEKDTKLIETYFTPLYRPDPADDDVKGISAIDLKDSKIAP